MDFWFKPCLLDGFLCLIDQIMLQFYEEFTVAQVSTVKFISGAFFLADRSACLNK